MKIAGQHTPFWGGQHGRFLQLIPQTIRYGKSNTPKAYDKLKINFVPSLMEL
jgi:hypothetical protein